MSEIFYRPWFRRVWVIQEILHAQNATFVCGGDFVVSRKFLTIINSIIEADKLSVIISFHPDRSKLANAAREATRRSARVYGASSEQISQSIHDD